MTSHILAIESSCDDTSVAITKDAQILSMGVSNQIIHEKYGGVVPELASRAHLQNIVPLVETTLRDSGLQKEDITAVAVTQGPGLLGSLLVGTSFAKAFALARNLPIIAVNHMEAHILAHMIDDPKPSFPFLCLTVSGGHTQIVLVKSPLDFELIGETLDDAAGEAFDKTGKMLGLPYPAGPLIDKLSQAGQAVYPFTKPQLDGYNFSFSGLKTGVRNFLKNNTDKDKDFISKHLEDICCSVQTTIVEILIETLERAARDLGIQSIAISGGVSANSFLRQSLENMANQNGWKAYVPSFKYCTDNAGMIAIAAYYKLQKGVFADQSIHPKPRLKI